ncbi:MAG: peptidylprolyl isomerase, partial [Deltaproteobacteria bacterium]|nr:peptidylprolyl isomerase [Deltaproteobacteria bacterium]
VNMQPRCRVQQQERQARKGLGGRIFGWCVLALILSGGVSAWAGDALPEGIAARVNGVAITEGEVNRGMLTLEKDLKGRGQMASAAVVPEMRRMVLDRLIEQELFHQESRRAGIRVEDAEVEEHLRLIRGRFRSTEAFKKSMTETGVAEADLRSQIGRGLAVQKLMERRLEGREEVKEADLMAYYEAHPNRFHEPEQVRASHIVIMVGPRADSARKAAAREKIGSIRERLAKGEDFAALAREGSQGLSASRGGDLGFVGRGEMPAELEEVAFRMKPGEVSGLVETAMGYHLIQVHEVKPERAVPFEEVREDIRRRLMEETGKAERDHLLRRLKETAVIERTE